MPSPATAVTPPPRHSRRRRSSPRAHRLANQKYTPTGAGENLFLSGYRTWANLIRASLAQTHPDVQYGIRAVSLNARAHACTRCTQTHTHTNKQTRQDDDENPASAKRPTTKSGGRYLTETPSVFQTTRTRFSRGREDNYFIFIFILLYYTHTHIISYIRVFVRPTSRRLLCVCVYDMCMCT